MPLSTPLAAAHELTTSPDPVFLCIHSLSRAGGILLSTQSVAPRVLSTPSDLVFLCIHPSVCSRETSLSGPPIAPQGLTRLSTPFCPSFFMHSWGDTLEHTTPCTQFPSRLGTQPYPFFSLCSWSDTLECTTYSTLWTKYPYGLSIRFTHPPCVPGETTLNAPPAVLQTQDLSGLRTSPYPFFSLWSWGDTFEWTTNSILWTQYPSRLNTLPYSFSLHSWGDALEHITHSTPWTQYPSFSLGSLEQTTHSTLWTQYFSRLSTSLYSSFSLWSWGDTLEQTTLSIPWAWYSSRLSIPPHISFNLRF